MPFRAGEWARIKEVFEQARPLEAADRRAFVAAACATEPGLQEHVEKLLAAHQLASGFLESPPALSDESAVAASLEWQQIGGSADRAHRRGRDGRSLQGVRQEARSASCAEAAAGASHEGSRMAPPLSRRGESSIVAQPSAHPGGSRLRRFQRPSLHRDGVGRRADPA